MARLGVEICLLEIILGALVAPGDDAGGYVGVARGEVFAVGAAGVGEGAVGGVGRGKGGEGGVPFEGGGVVLLAVGVCDVEDGGFEEVVGCILRGVVG